VTRVVTLTSLLLLTGCPLFDVIGACAVSPPCAGAVEGIADFGTAALTLDDDALKLHEARHPPAQP
jgi:hypothetical protein